MMGFLPPAAADVAPSCAKARNSMRKCSLSTPRHTRKYELLTVRISVYAAFGHQAGCSGATPRHSTGGHLGSDPHGHASAQRRIIEADVLVVHQPVSREACG